MHDSIFQIGTKTDFNIRKCSVNYIFAELLNIHKDWEIIMQRKWCTETRFVDIWLGAWTANPYFANIVWLQRLNILDKPCEKYIKKRCMPIENFESSEITISTLVFLDICLK